MQMEDEGNGTSESSSESFKASEGNLVSTLSFIVTLHKLFTS